MARVKQVKKRSKQIGKTNGRRNIAELFGLTGTLPLVIPDCTDDVVSFFRMIIVDNFIPRLSGSVGVQEKEAFNRLF